MKNHDKFHINNSNIIGKKFGILTVLHEDGFLHSGKKRQKAYKCLCDCGNIKNIRRNNLVSGTSKSCGCKKLHSNKNFDTTSLLGKTFGRLTVTGFAYKERKKTNKRTVSIGHWNCICTCGEQCVKTKSNLKSGNTKSCGCLERERNLNLKNKLIQKNILPKGQAALNQYYASYKYRAKIKKIPFQITKEQFSAIIKLNCHYCDCKAERQYPSGGKLKHTTINDCIFVNGIDRKNSTIGYTIENCVPCCAICNMAKFKMSEDKFMDWIQRIAQKYNSQSNNVES
jgi:hypothetical protein